MKKRVLAMVLAAVMVFVIAGCGSSSSSSSGSSSSADSAETEAAAAADTGAAEASADAGEAAGGAIKDLSELQIVGIVGTMNDAFYQTVAEGFEAECAALGIPTPTISDQQLDGSICTDLINTYVAAEYDAIALSANDPAGTVPAIEYANTNGVAMFMFDCTLDDEYADQYISFVGSNNYSGGVTAAEYILENAPAGSTVACLTYASAQSTQDRQAGFEDTIDAAIEAGTVDLVRAESVDCDNDQAKATDNMTNLITMYGDDLSYVFVVGDPTGYGTLAAIQSQGASTKIVGFDAGQTACEYIADTEGVGQIWVAEVAQDPYGIGAGIVDKIAEYFTTGTVAGEQKDLIECQLVTAENVADYL